MAAAPVWSSTVEPRLVARWPYGSVLLASRWQPAGAEDVRASGGDPRSRGVAAPHRPAREGAIARADRGAPVRIAEPATTEADVSRPGDLFTRATAPALSVR